MRYPELVKNLHYHVYNRAVSRQIIFKDDRDYRYFMYKISQYKEKYGVRIFTYCILPNHFHLLLRSDCKPENISKFMQSLQRVYARFYNKKYKHSGHVFEGRFCHKEVMTNRDLAKVKKYILNNPGKHGYTEKYYKWSYYWISRY